MTIHRRGICILPAVFLHLQWLCFFVPAVYASHNERYECHDEAKDQQTNYFIPYVVFLLIVCLEITLLIQGCYCNLSAHKCMLVLNIRNRDHLFWLWRRLRIWLGIWWWWYELCVQPIFKCKLFRIATENVVFCISYQQYSTFR